MPRIYIWAVTGMHCASCERLIGDTLKKVPGAKEVEVSLSKRKAALKIDDQAADPDLAAINKELKPFGYALVDASAPAVRGAGTSQPSWSRRILEALGMLAAVYLVWLMLIAPLTRLVPTISATQSLVALFGLGIVASLSTCLATTGGFLLAYTSVEKTRSKIAWVHLGRLAAFGVGGLFLGAIGGALPSLGGLYGWISLVLGIGFIFVGLHLLGLTPSLASMGIRIPARASSFADKIARRRGKATPFVVGALTFILPCGFTQTAQALALASGSASRGALMLLAFSLGTLPVLIGVTLFGSSAKPRHRVLRLATGAILLLFALSQIEAGLAIMGSSFTINGLFHPSAPAAQPVVTDGQEQAVVMQVTDRGYSPDQIVLKKGIPVKWDIRASDNLGCASSIVVPQYNIRQSLSAGSNIIRFTPTETGTIPFSCSMGMVRGTFIVE